MTIQPLCLPPLSMKQTSVHAHKALIWPISGCLLVAYSPLATCSSHCWLYPSERLCQGRISSDRCTLFLRNLPGEALCQAGFIREAAWKSCSLRSTLSPFTAASLGKHMAVVKAQLSLWLLANGKRIQKQWGELAGSSPPVTQPVRLFRETSDPPPPTPPPPPCFSLCNSTPLSSPGSATGHTAQHMALTCTDPLKPDWIDDPSVIFTHTSAATRSLHVAVEVKRWLADSWH